MRANWKPIALLAIPGVAITAGIVAACMHYFGALAWMSALLLGAILSATDPVAVVAIFRRLRVPRPACNDRRKRIAAQRRDCGRPVSSRHYGNDRDCGSCADRNGRRRGCRRYSYRDRHRYRAGFSRCACAAQRGLGPLAERRDARWRVCGIWFGREVRLVGNFRRSHVRNRASRTRAKPHKRRSRPQAWKHFGIASRSSRISCCSSSSAPPWTLRASRTVCPRPRLRLPR